MQTNTPLAAATRTISIAATPDDVLSFIADPHNLPRWAPDFAQAVQPAGEDWLIDQGEQQARISVRVSREAGTVDLLRAADRTRGAFTRVIPNGTGSEYIFTLFFDSNVDDAAIARQMTIVETELETVRTLCQA